MRQIAVLPDLKQQYYDALTPKPAWPMTRQRANAIYRTMARTIRQASDADKLALVDCMITIARDFDSSCGAVTATQQHFDRWFDRQLTTLQAVPFRWTDAGTNRRDS